MSGFWNDFNIVIHRPKRAKMEPTADDRSKVRKTEKTERLASKTPGVKKTTTEVKKDCDSTTGAKSEAGLVKHADAEESFQVPSKGVKSEGEWSGVTVLY